MFLFKLIGVCTIMLPLLAGLSVYGRLNRMHRVFLGFIVFSALFEAINTYIGLTTDNNLFMFRVFLICDFVFFVWYYHHVFERPLWDMRFNVFPFLMILVYQLTPPEWWFLSTSVSWFHLLVFIFFIVQSLFALLRSFELYQTELLTSPTYWVSFARLFYFMLIFFSFVLPEVSMEGQSRNSIFLASNMINAISNMSLNLLYTMSFICLKMKIR